jgi:hypothetical protein
MSEADTLSLREELATERRAIFAFAATPPHEMHPKMTRLIRHWQSLAPAPGLLPGRQHLDPIRIADLLPHIWLVDVVDDDPRRYRARLVGGGLVDAGAPFRRGNFFSDVMTPEETRAAINVFDGIAMYKHVNWRRGPSALRHMEHIFALERVMMPMASDSRTVDMVLCMTLFYWTDGRVY